VFTPHEVHTAEPVTDFHLPTPQGVHAKPSAPVYPAMQVHIELFTYENVLFGHAVQVAAAADEYVLTSQPVHIALPLKALNVPAAHAVHATPLVPVYPAMQSHVELPTSEEAAA
jgi:hypothetical protein